MAEIILAGIKNVGGTCNQITVFILNQVSSRLVTLFKFIYAPVEICNNLAPFVCLKFLNFVFQIAPLLVPGVSTVLTSYLFFYIVVIRLAEFR